MKCSFLAGSPNLGVCLLGVVQKGAGDVKEGRDEFLVEIAESQEGSYSLDIGQWGPFSNGFEFDGVHLYSSSSHYHAEIFHFFG